MNADIYKYKKLSMILTLYVTYYGTELKSKQIFPYKVYFGGKKNELFKKFRL